MLAYASDFTLLDTALIAHGRFIFDPPLMLASLDHAIWFHRRFRVDDWLLYAQDSPSSGAGGPSAAAPCSRGRGAGGLDGAGRARPRAPPRMLMPFIGIASFCSILGMTARPVGR